jgi:hypothetical protein
MQRNPAAMPETTKILAVLLGVVRRKASEAGQQEQYGGGGRTVHPVTEKASVDSAPQRVRSPTPRSAGPRSRPVLLNDNTAEALARKTIGSVSGHRQSPPRIPQVADPDVPALLDQAVQLTDTRQALPHPRSAPAGSTDAGSPGIDSPVSAPAVRVPEPRRPTSFALLQGPSGQVAAHVSPKPAPVTLLVVSPAHGQVRVNGLARWFPAHTVHATDSGVVVDGSHCKVKATDHFHVRTAVVSLEALTKPGPGQAALAELLRNPTTGIAAFQRAMHRLTRPLEEDETQARLPVTQTHLTVVDGAAAVQQGNGSRANLATKYVIEEIELPVCELLAVDQGLVRALAEVALDPAGGLKAPAFTRQALRAAGRTGDLALVNYCEDLHGEASVYGLFGITSVSSALAVMIGDHNQVTTALSVRLDGCSLDDGPASLSRIREGATEIRAAQTPAAAVPSPYLRRLLAAAFGPQAVDEQLPSRSAADVLRETLQPADLPATAVYPPVTGISSLY